jgi:hypothetical protein
VKQHTINPGSGTRAPGDIAVAVLLALGAVFERRPRTHRAWIAAVPIVAVNYVAFRAQLRYWETYLSHSDALLVSAALESIAIYLAWQAHVAQLADDSALRLRLAAYGMAAGIGALNYSHYMHPGWRPTPAAVVFGGMSAISPWLWSIHSRRESRDALKATGQIDPHAVRLGATRWIWHLYRCFRVMWAASWIGETRPAEAIKLIQEDRILTASGAGDVLTADIESRQPDHGPVREPVPGTARPAALPRPARATMPGHGGKSNLAAVRVAELKAVTEQELAVALAAVPVLPSVRSLADHEKLAGHGSESSRRRAARRVLAAVSAQRNGGSPHDSVDRA